MMMMKQRTISSAPVQSQFTQRAANHMTEEDATNRRPSYCHAKTKGSINWFLHCRIIPRVTKRGERLTSLQNKLIVASTPGIQSRWRPQTFFWILSHTLCVRRIPRALSAAFQHVARQVPSAAEDEVSHRIQYAILTDRSKHSTGTARITSTG